MSTMLIIIPSMMAGATVAVMFIAILRSGE